MKNILTAAVLALGLTVTAAPVKAMDVEFCKAISDAAGYVAVMRDQGVGPQGVYDLLLQSGFDDEMAVILLKMVYLDVSDASPDEIKNTIFTLCVSEAS
tara:strand:- start:100 stop:396 length:297 start_codon:yes stop_codon:yes gene_type:complete